MRLSRSASVSKQRKNRKIGSPRAKRKHKKLDAICEDAYNQNHRSLESKFDECNDNASEVRRSSRVRRPPAVLDASPPPPKKRQKVDHANSFSQRAIRSAVQIESPCSTSKKLEQESASWRSRLRGRDKKVSFGVERSSLRGKRKLFEDSDSFKELPNSDSRDLNDDIDGSLGETLMVVKSKRPGRIKASNCLSNGHKKFDLGNSDSDEEGFLEYKAVDVKDCSLDNGVKDDNVAMESVEQKGNEVPLRLEQDDCLPNINVLHSVEQNNLVDQSGTMDQNNQDQPDAVDQNNQVGQPGTEEHNKQGEVDQPGTVDRNNQDQPETVDRYNEVGQHVNLEFGATPADHAGQGICDDGQRKDKKVEKLDEVDSTPSHQLDKPRIREGRRCGLCGGGTDGKPPRKLVQNGAGSDHEAFSGSSSQEEPSYDIWDGFGDEPGWLGRLLGPINDRFGIARIWVHQNCAVWSPEVYFAGLGCLKNVRAALCRGRVLKCSRCGRRGATIGCRVDRCPKTYHLPCARASNCIFEHRKFLIACGDHRKLFQPKYSDMLKKMKVRKMKTEMRKLANDASRKDHEAEEKWLDNCGEDEEFLKRENRRLHRDLLRIAPVYIGGSTSENEIPSHGWESVGGLQDVIRCLKEVVILPLLYPEFFDNLGLTPPRGVLLHGYPGTGKTLVVRALIGSCSHGDKRIAYFARKGADCLGKYVGDAERQLRLLFQVAEKSQPSIIFFDEIDGLAPARTRQLDQTHSSVVSTLLALLDGLKSRGSVVVIGATNRPDAIDPALRRPGRFDREIYFPLPSVKDREAILSLHTQKWPTPVSGSLLQWIARKTVGYAGADLQALCTQTAIIALKRKCPWQKFLSAAGEKSNGKRPPLPTFAVEERDWLEALSCAPPPCSRREAGMAANDVVSSPLPAHLIHCLLQPLSRLLVSIYQDERISLPPSLCKAAAAIKNIIFSALDKKKVHSNYWQSHVHDLLQQADVASDLKSKLSRGSILIGDANVASFDALDADTEVFGSSKMQSRLVQTNALSSLSYAGKKSSFCVLIAGSPGSGQRHLASCILHCFAGNVVIRKVDLATISQEAGGDMVYGLTQILMGCANVGSCMVFMPRIDLWAVKTCHQGDEEENSGPSANLKSPGDNASFQTRTKVINEENKSTAENCQSETLKQQNPELRASLLWSSFVEQVESMFVSASLMILATSDIPLQLLPLRIRQFFGTDISNLSVSTRMGNTIPRFSVHVDGNFNHDMVIDSCAAKLSNDVARYFVQLIHHRTHTSSLKSNETFDAIEADMDMPCHKLDTEPSIAQGSKNKHCPPPPSKKEVKGKSNLMLAISTFGYQILQYPHFSELCWVTSKLKDGPCTEISGPWKGWPFNSCIVRPNETTEKIAVASGSSSDKSKEKYGLVRGLIAIGLSAYRGAYTSLREVTADVRKVLELLVLQINAKIQMGKDRYQFIRILSQVAYLEDMVDSWAYTLRSLEKEVLLTEANPEPTCDRSLDQNDKCEDHPVQGDVNKSKSPHDMQSLEYIGCHKKKGVDDSCAQLTSDFEDSNPVIREQNGNCLQPSSLGVSDYYSEVGSLNHSNGFARTDCFVSAENGPHNQVDLGGVQRCSVGDGCSQDNGLTSAGRNIPSDYEKPNSSGNEMDTNLIANRLSGLPVDPGGICLYRICSKCLFNIYHLMQKRLICQWEMKVYNLTADEVHDIVTSLSLNIHSAIAKFCLSESLSISFDKNHKFGNYKTLFEGQEVTKCQCGTSGNRLAMAMECSCHSQSKRETAQESSSGFPLHELDSEFIYRDGVLVVLDPEKDVSFHCKFHAICLCSFIEYIVMTKQPSD